MRLYKDIVQNSEDWFAIRYGKVGGSTMKDLMANYDKPVRNNAIYFDLLSCKFEPFSFEEQYMSADMERGHAYEPLARQEFERINDVVVERVGWAEKDNGLIGISPDGLIGTTEAFEAKCPSRKTHMRYLVNPMDMVEDYPWQTVQYFNVFEQLEKLNFVSFRPENEAKSICHVIVDRDTKIKVSAKINMKVSELIEMVLVRESELLQCINEDVERLSAF